MPHLPKIVRQRLQGPTNASNLHPDADVLTAFAEKSLPDSERAHVTDHLARCGDCREIVALALPATKETTVVGRSAGTAWRTGWFLRWGVVAAGIALAASVGIVQLRERHLMHVADSAMSRQEVGYYSYSRRSSRKRWRGRRPREKRSCARPQHGARNARRFENRHRPGKVCSRHRISRCTTTQPRRECE